MEHRTRIRPHARWTTRFAAAARNQVTRRSPQGIAFLKEPLGKSYAASDVVIQEECRIKTGSPFSILGWHFIAFLVITKRMSDVARIGHQADCSHRVQRMADSTKSIHDLRSRSSLRRD